MKRLFFQWIYIFALLNFTACGDDVVDVTPPSMEAMAYSPTPVPDEICGTTEPNVFHLTGGDELVFDVIFSDNTSLSWAIQSGHPQQF
ncbi:MAG: hypothetical protein IPN76_33090 [Saprospiraceae bacterium]|nr:hypothetical protein [Saprospiraceae bacterium]